MWITPDPASVANVRVQVATAQDAIIAAHFDSATNPRAGQGFNRELVRFAITPGFAVSVSRAELDALAADPRVQYIHYNRMVPPTLNQSVPLIGMSNAYAIGATGAGQAVVVLDTGVKSSHEFLAGKVIAEACFSNNNVAGGNTLCPNGQGSQIGAGAASPDIANCTVSSTNICDHGTHVAGIAAGLNTNQQSGEPANGVAKNGNIWAIQIFTRSGSDVGAFFSDIIRGLDHVFANMNSLPGGVKVASTNMSLGGGLFSSTCDSSVAKPSIDNLRNAGVLSAIAAGNDGSTSQVSEPGCISTAVTVGSTTKSDVISSFSNMSPVVDLIAPGSSIQSSVTVVPASNTTTYSFFSGTSMATPHVAGAIAAIRSACPNATANAIEAALKSTGLSISDTRPGGTQTKPRIRVDLAVGAACSTTPLPPSPPACVLVAQLGDFNGDGRADVLFQRTDGTLMGYLMNGTQIQQAGVIGQMGTEWQIGGIGDFNGDGKADILFKRSTDGALLMLLMNGLQVQSAPIFGQIGPEWKVAGVGSFTGNGRADILFRRSGDGALLVVLMNGTQIQSSTIIGQIGLEWTVYGVRDFNGDGKADILFRRSGDGALLMLLMNGTQVLSAPIFGQLGPEWLDAGVGDFNGDGRSDILYRRSTDGALLMLLMNGAQVLSAPIFAQLGAEWENVGAGNLNGDGTADILFRRSDGSVLVFLMNGTQVQTSAIVSQLGLEWSSCYVSPASPALSLNARK
jgi:subtilisin family serine protease